MNKNVISHVDRTVNYSSIFAIDETPEKVKIYQENFSGDYLLEDGHRSFSTVFLKERGIFVDKSTLFIDLTSLQSDLLSRHTMQEILQNSEFRLPTVDELKNIFVHQMMINRSLDFIGRPDCHIINMDINNYWIAGSVQDNFHCRRVILVGNAKEEEPYEEQEFLFRKDIKLPQGFFAVASLNDHTDCRILQFVTENQHQKTETLQNVKEYFVLPVTCHFAEDGGPGDFVYKEGKNLVVHKILGNKTEYDQNYVNIEKVIFSNVNGFYGLSKRHQMSIMCK